MIIEQSFCLAHFSTLLPRVNSWLREHLALDLVKCETVEKKLTSLELLSEQSPTYEQPERSESGQSESGQSIQTLYLKGLRYTVPTIILVCAYISWKLI